VYISQSFQEKEQSGFQTFGDVTICKFWYSIDFDSIFSPKLRLVRFDCSCCKI